MNYLLKCKRSDGFTLVELIVVIAILAILAGVAVPAYTGYIKKAEEAGDLQLLSAVNTAFAAACLENGVDLSTVTDAQEIMTGKTVTGISAVTATPAVDAAKVAKISDSFGRYFTGGEFKVYASLDFENGSFVGSKSTALGVYEGLLGVLTGGTYDEAISNLNGSTYIQAEGLGVEGLMNKVSDVTDLAASIMADDQFAYIFNGEVYGGDYALVMAQALGVDTTNMDELIAFSSPGGKLDQMTDKKIAELANKPVSELTEEDRATYKSQAQNQIYANNAVLTAAQNTAGKKAEDLLAQVQAGLPANELATVKASGEMDVNTLSKAAAAYAMYTAYAYQLPEGAERDAAIKQTENFGTVITAINDTNNASWQEYLNGDKALSDMQAYMGSMDMINGSVTTDPAASENLLLNGFNNEQLVELLKQTTGNN